VLFVKAVSTTYMLLSKYLLDAPESVCETTRDKPCTKAAPESKYE